MRCRPPGLRAAIGPNGTVRAIDVSVGGFLEIADQTARIPFGEFVFVGNRATACGVSGSLPDTKPAGTRRVIGTDQALSNSPALVERGSDSLCGALSADLKPCGATAGPDRPTVEDRNRRAAARADEAFAGAAGYDDRSLRLTPPERVTGPDRPYRIMLLMARQDREVLEHVRPSAGPPTDGPIAYRLTKTNQIAPSVDERSGSQDRE